MKSATKKDAPASPPISSRQLRTQIAEARVHVEALVQAARSAKARYKDARKAFKHAKKLAKHARKNLEQLGETWEERPRQAAPVGKKKKPARPGRSRTLERKAVPGAPPKPGEIETMAPDPKDEMQATRS